MGDRMIKLKKISKEGIPDALKMANRYRLLNEPTGAESICKDILAVDAENEEAKIILLLSLTDQFGHEIHGHAKKAKDLIGGLNNEYDKAYYAGVICERQAKALLARGNPGAQFHAYDFFEQAMDFFKDAESNRPAGKDEPILRWNACARIIQEKKLTKFKEEKVEPYFD